jgi:hypothetical protein
MGFVITQSGLNGHRHVKATLPFLSAFSDEKYVINGGEFGGLVKIVELTENK